MPDTQAPTVNNTNFTDYDTTPDSITVYWEKATDNVTPADKILYKVFIIEEGAPGKPQQAIAGYNFYSYTFTGLKDKTNYLIHVFAEDEAGNVIRYPGKNCSKRIMTGDYDDKEPTVKDTQFTSIKATSDSISITWEKATDNRTPADKITYRVYIMEVNSSEDRLVCTGCNLTAYTFRGLKPKTEYYVHVTASDEAGNYIRYPGTFMSKSVTTKEVDNQAPVSPRTSFERFYATYNSIEIYWKKATDNLTRDKSIVYSVYIKEYASNANPRMVYSEKDISSYKFTGLKPDTEYLVHVIASDEAGNTLRYPGNFQSQSIRTKPADKTPPTVKSRALKVSDVLDDRFAIEWEKALDNTTAEAKILYKVALTEHDNPKDPWHIVREERGIKPYHLFKDLKPDTRYAFYVKAIDEAGNVLQYPADNASNKVKTLARRVNSISFTIEQGASVLYGTNTISFIIEYTYYYMNVNDALVARGKGSWEGKWSNKKKKTGTITLPPDRYFDNNQIFVRIQSRKAASRGLNTWVECCSGYVDVTSGVLKFRLAGSYYYYSVHLDGSASNGYSKFK